jgi:hypothetical protein
MAQRSSFPTSNGFEGHTLCQVIWRNLHFSVYERIMPHMAMAIYDFVLIFAINNDEQHDHQYHGQITRASCCGELYRSSKRGRGNVQVFACRVLENVNEGVNIN